MRRSSIMLALVFIAIFAFGNLADAQGFFGRDKGKFNHMRRGMHMKNLENLRLLKLLEVLELNDDQNDKFISAFSKFRNESKDIDEGIENEVTALAEYLRSENIEDKVVMEKVRVIEKLKTDRENARADFYEEVKDILTAQQLGKMIVFQERFERELLETVRGFRAPDTPPNPELNRAPDLELAPMPDVSSDNQ